MPKRSPFTRRPQGVEARPLHTPDDRRGPRDVLLNGELLKRVVYANTRRGLVRVTDAPPKVHKHRKRVISRTLRGKVEVRFIR